jgi:hypothetical protein
MIGRSADPVVNSSTHFFWLFFQAFVASLVGIWLAASTACAFGAEPPQGMPLRIAVNTCRPTDT